VVSEDGVKREPVVEDTELGMELELEARISTREEEAEAETETEAEADADEELLTVAEAEAEADPGLRDEIKLELVPTEADVELGISVESVHVKMVLVLWCR
jgi:hypothetical protein